MKTTKEYTKAKREFLADKTCEICPRIATDLHHARGRLGPLLMDKRFWIPMCFQHHRWVHDNPAAARKLGLICKKGLWNTPPKGNLDL